MSTVATHIAMPAGRKIEKKRGMYTKLHPHGWLQRGREGSLKCGAAPVVGCADVVEGVDAVRCSVERIWVGAQAAAVVLVQQWQHVVVVLMLLNRGGLSQDLENLARIAGERR